MWRKRTHRLNEMDSYCPQRMRAAWSTAQMLLAVSHRAVSLCWCDTCKAVAAPFCFHTLWGAVLLLTTWRAPTAPVVLCPCALPHVWELRAAAAH